VPTAAATIVVALTALASAACNPGSRTAQAPPISGPAPNGAPAPGEPAAVLPQARTGHKNAEYLIDGRSVRLVDGVAESAAAPGSTARIVTRYFGNEVWHDLNGDGQEDVVFLVTQETGGSGTFYYVVAAVSAPGGYSGSQALLLGDRIAPQTTQLLPGGIVAVNYAERRPGEPFSTQPSVGKSIWLKLDTATLQFGEVVQDFEGEANPAQMTLDMKTWAWTRAVDVNGLATAPKDDGVFTITFGTDGEFAATTDCNRAAGGYTTDGSLISFGDMAATKMYCEGSQEGEFLALLGTAERYEFTSRGELVLQLRGGGSVNFR
jgi:heat shock protein HslJ